MLYLLYIRNGFIKKFPLKSDTIVLGRYPDCEFFLDEECVSKFHAKIKVNNFSIEIEDLGSKNGIFMDGQKIDTAEITINESFQICQLEFFLKEGNPEEFEISPASRELIKNTASLINNYQKKTRTSLNLFDQTLVSMLRMGFKTTKFESILELTKFSIASVLEKGNLFIVQILKGKVNLLSKLLITPPVNLDLEKMIYKYDLLGRVTFFKLRVKENIHLYSLCQTVANRPILLIYLMKSDKPLDSKTQVFLQNLGREIFIIYSLIRQHHLPYDRQDKRLFNLEMITESENIIQIFQKCKKMARSDIYFLIEGETGVGKELLAKFIHNHANTPRGQYIGLNCSAIPESLLESELFGYEKGAFTGAHAQTPGKLELASDGTLVLDEIGDMPLNLQSKLLRVLQEGEFYRIGGKTPIRTALRIISLTNQDLKEKIARQAFRDDLYYRIAQFRINIPPLRERKSDIPLLANFFLEEFCKKYDIHLKGFSTRMMEKMKNYSWPGNIRELKNEVKSLVSQAENGEILDQHMLKEEILNFEKKDHHPSSVVKSERERILGALQHRQWNKSLAAKDLNMSRMTLYKKLKQYGI